MASGSTNLSRSSRKRPLVARYSSQNLQHHLRDREAQWKRPHLSRHLGPYHQTYEREMLKCITPNLSVHNVDHSLGYIRKFTPNGRHLLSFSQDQRSLQIFDYHGVAKLGELLQNVTAELITASDLPEHGKIRESMYDKLFTLRRSIQLISTDWSNPRSHLNREFSVFMEDGKYVLIGAISKPHMEMSIPVEYYYEYANFSDDYDMFDYTLFVVDLQNECVTDTYEFFSDCILLAHNHGVSVYGNTVAVLSKCRQCVDLLLLQNGQLLLKTCVGRYDAELRGPRMSWLLSELKQKILAHMYRQILSIHSQKLRKDKIQEFYKNFDLYESMTMTKMQLIDTDTILLRYEHPNTDAASDASMSPSADEKNKFRLYVFYCVSSKLVLKVYYKNSIELLYVLRNFCDNFRNVRSLQSLRQSSSPSNNAYFRAAFNSTITSIPGGQTEAALRFNPTLPISCQSFTTSPYLDYNLFNYNDRLISALERPKIGLMEAICFKDRNTNATKFRIHMDTKPDGESVCGTCRELVAYVFHPYEPFIISIQKLATRHIVNFHVYNQSTIVKQ